MPVCASCISAFHAESVQQIIAFSNLLSIIEIDLKKKINIAIDGESSCGKGTIARELARALGYIFVDSGAMYRAVTLYAIDHQLTSQDFVEKPEILERIKIEFRLNEAGDFYETFLNGESVEHRIRSMEVNRLVSEISKVRNVRRHLVKLQQEIGKDKGVVMDGRDIGTVVFPDAELKIYMTAHPEIRAKRRYHQLMEKGREVDYQEILNNLIERDRIDSTREEGPLRKAADAITLDNTDMTPKQQMSIALTWAKGVIAAQ